MSQSVMFLADKQVWCQVYGKSTGFSHQSNQFRVFKRDYLYRLFFLFIQMLHKRAFGYSGLLLLCHWCLWPDPLIWCHLCGVQLTVHEFTVKICVPANSPNLGILGHGGGNIFLEQFWSIWNVSTFFQHIF